MNSMTEVQEKDNRERILLEAEGLIAQVERAYRQGEAVHELERGLFRQLLQMGYQLVEQFLGLCGTGDQGAQLSLSDGREVNRLELCHGRAYRSVFGEHRLERAVYGTREGQKIDYVPLDCRLQLPSSKFSYLLQEWDQALAVEQPYGQVNEIVERILGFGQSVHSLQRINQQLSSSVEAFWEARPPASVAQGEQLVVCSADNKGVVIRGEADEQAVGAEPGEQPAPGEVKAGGKKMALIGAVYTITPYVRSPQQVLKALFEEPASGEAKPPPRPKPLEKYVRASLERDEHDTMAPAYESIFSWLAQEQHQRHPNAEQPVIMLMDGQRALWHEAQRVFEGVHYVEVLDLIHALGYLWEAAELVYPSHRPGPCPKNIKQQRLVFVKQQTERVLHGQVQSVIRSLCARRSTLNVHQRETMYDIVGYLRNNAPRMQYDQYLKAGYPIATGVIEGACRHVICDRMERSGMRWVMPGAKAMLGLRCIGINQEWDPFMNFHIQRENQRLYPVKAANDDAGLSSPLAA